MSAKTDRITVRLPVSLIGSMDDLVELGEYRNRTDLVYNAIKTLLREKGAAVKETIEAEKGVLEYRKLAAEIRQLKDRMGVE